jgi:hypothetical protein
MVAGRIDANWDCRRRSSMIINYRLLLRVIVTPTLQYFFTTFLWKRGFARALVFPPPPSVLPKSHRGAGLDNEKLCPKASR